MMTRNMTRYDGHAKHDNVRWSRQTRHGATVTPNTTRSADQRRLEDVHATYVKEQFHRIILLHQ